MSRYIDADVLKETMMQIANNSSMKKYIIDTYIDTAQTAECFTLEELESWLWSIALNNSDNSFGDSVESLIDRLDGFKNFVNDSRMKGDNQ